jgi:hypothetical protein
MNDASKLALCLGCLVGVLSVADDAAAQCCPDYTLSTSCSNLKKTRWCIANDAPNGFGTRTLPAVFCSYGEQVVSTLESVFNIEAPQTFEFDLMTCESSGGNNCTPGQSTGYAQTPTSCGTFGNAVTFDAFTGNAYNTQYFWGYLLSLHEAINQWTGLASGGWPTDWWADHQSAFPNLMDFHIMNLLGTTNNDNNLLTGAAAQKARFYPGGDSADPKVVGLDNVYGMMPNMDGLAGFSKVFSLVAGDKMTWGNLGSNPNQKLSEYVIAYMALVVGQNGGEVLKTVQGPSANGGGNICNGTSDGQDPTYMCSESDVDAIATAHCALAAKGQPAADLTAYGMGDFASVSMGPCGATCPAECGCDTSPMHCVAPWVAKNGGLGGADAGETGVGGSGASSGMASSGASSTGSAGAETGAESGQSTGGQSAGTTSGFGSGSGSTSGSASGSPTLGVSGSLGAASGAGGSGSGTSGSGGLAGGAGASAPSPTQPSPQGRGCSCRMVGTRAGGSALSQIVAALCASVIAVSRRRRGKTRRGSPLWMRGSASVAREPRAWASRSRGMQSSRTPIRSCAF